MFLETKIFLLPYCLEYFYKDIHIRIYLSVQNFQFRYGSKIQDTIQRLTEVRERFTVTHHKERHNLVGKTIVPKKIELLLTFANVSEPFLENSGYSFIGTAVLFTDNSNRICYYSTSIL